MSLMCADSRRIPFDNWCQSVERRIHGEVLRSRPLSARPLTSVHPGLQRRRYGCVLVSLDTFIDVVLAEVDLLRYSAA